MLYCAYKRKLYRWKTKEVVFYECKRTGIYGHCPYCRQLFCRAHWMIHRRKCLKNLNLSLEKLSIKRKYDQEGKDVKRKKIV